MRIIYICIAVLLAPLMHAVFLYKSRKAPGWRQDLAERYGRGPAVPPGGLWVHASSVGEVQASVPLVRELLERYPDRHLTYTTFTPSGRERVRALFGERVHTRYVPVDLPWVVRRFLRSVQPRIAIILETELWPTLFHECDRRGIPIVLASARVSPRSVASYRRVARLFRAALANDLVIAAQSTADAERFVSIGANPARTHVVGNVKFDHSMPSDLPARAAELRARLGAARPVWVAGSTHEGEEEIVLDAHERVRAAHPSALLVLVPRKLQRVGEVESLLLERGARYVKRSTGAAVSADVDVLLVDTLGELVTFYGAGEVALVGGSLVPAGGHNLLEPAAFAKPVLTGPANWNAQEIATLLFERDAARVVHDAADLATQVGMYLTDPALRERDGRAGLEVLEANRGAVARVVALVAPLLSAR